MRSGSGTERVLRAALAATERRGARALLLAAPALDLPMYAPQSGERTGAARALVDRIGRANGVIVASPAYHGGVSGLLKSSPAPIVTAFARTAAGQCPIWLRTISS